jgi:hypothetical protein
MKEKIFEQINKELKLASWLDLVVLTLAVSVTLTLFGIAMVTAAGSVGSMSASLMGGLGRSIKSFNTVPTIIMFASLAAIVAINWYGIKVLLKNKAQRAKLNEGMMKLYKDEGMDQYHDGSIFKTYETRYTLFAVIMGSVGALSLIATLAVFIDNLTTL